MCAIVITKGKCFSLGWNKACTSRLVNDNTQPSAPSTGSINPFSLSPLPKTGASAAHAINRSQPSNPGAACAGAARVWDSARHELDHQGRSLCLCVPPTFACALSWRGGGGGGTCSLSGRWTAMMLIGEAGASSLLFVVCWGLLTVRAMDRQGVTHSARRRSGGYRCTYGMTPGAHR